MEILNMNLPSTTLVSNWRFWSNTWAN